MQNMSFSLTTRQFRQKSKTVTRRLGWKKAKAGQRVMGCEKCQGLKKGQAINRLGEIEIVSATLEVLFLITPAECRKEGFPDMTPQEFVAMFCKANHCQPDTVINRIEYRYIEGGVGK